MNEDLYSAASRTAFKKRLMHKCVEMIEARIATNLLATRNAQAAANAEEKSSAGDKYETARAMGHLEKDMHARQLEANRKELAALLSVDCSKAAQIVEPGSVVVCNQFSFFIAAGLGKIHFDNRDIYLLSPNAPIAKSLFKKTKGDSIIFNKIPAIITAVF